MTEPVPQRIGDAERDRAAGYLREHLAQGRLTQDEFDERVGTALSARTDADLTPLFADLPDPRPKSATGPVAAPAAWPAYAPPPGEDIAVRPEAAPPAEVSSPASTAMGIVAAVAWPAWLLLMFATGWQYVWLVFIPIIISSIAGKTYGDHRRLRHRDRYRDRRQLGE